MSSSPVSSPSISRSSSPPPAPETQAEKKTTKGLAPNEMPLAPLSIHRINPDEKWIRDHQDNGKNLTYTLAAWIDHWMQSNRRGLSFKQVELKNQESWWVPIRNKHFFLKIYSAKQEYDTSFGVFLKKGGCDSKQNFKNTMHHFLFILFRVRKLGMKHIFDVFGLTQGQAWHSIQRRDFRFPHLVVKQIGEPAVHSARFKAVCGEGHERQQSYKQPHLIKLTECMYEIVEGLETRIKQDASILSCSPFQTTKGKPAKRPGNMTIGKGYIRFGRRLSISGFAEICDHLAKFARGEKTFHPTAQTVEEPDPLFEYLDHIRPVTYEESLALDDAFLTAFSDSLDGAPLEGYLLTHRYVRDFAQSPISLFHKKKEIKEWPTPPSFERLVRKIQKVVALEGISSTARTAWIDDLTISFVHRGEPRSEVLMNYIEGEFRYQGNLYFRVNAIWQQLDHEYCVSVQNDFTETVRSCRLLPVDNHYLHRPWMNQEGWAAFSANDLEEITGDGTVAGEICDSLISKKITLIHPRTGNGMGYRLFPSLKQLAGFLTHWREIEDLLLKKEKIDLTVLQNLGIGNAAAVLEELKKERSIAYSPKGKPKKQDSTDELSSSTSQPSRKRPHMSASQPPAKKSRSTQTIVLLCCPDDLQLPPSLSQTQKVKLRNFLQSKSELALQTVQEGPYNESYLFEEPKNKGWLTFDRVFVTDGVELADVIRITKSAISLHAVKAGFGKETRVALSQIRIAARLAISSKRSNVSSTNVFSDWFKKATSDSEKSPYRDLLKERLSQMSLGDFVSLFKDRRLIFVYSFNDSDGRKERLLENELCSPHTPITKDDFNNRSFTHYKGQFCMDSEKIMNLLKQARYLDSSGKVTGLFLNTKKEAFKIGPPAEKCHYERIYDAMHKKIKSNPRTQFESMIAKMEVIDTARVLKGLGIEFRICQIRRPREAFGYGEIGKPLFLSETPASQSIPLLTLPSSLSQIEDDRSFTVGDCSYERLETASDGACAIHALLGTHDNHTVSQSSPRETFREALESQSDSEQIQEVLFETFTDILQEADQENEHAQMVFSDKDIITEFREVVRSQDRIIPQDLFEHYLNCIADKDYWFSDAEIRLMAYLFNKRVTLFHTDRNGITSQNGEPFGPEDGEKRLIYHEGNHFEAAQITIPL